MPSHNNRLPPLRSLVTFEAAARHLSFTRAGDELCVTQAAVSRQIKSLEESLGIVLFDRGHRSLCLTAPAVRLQQAVSLGLGRISIAVEDIRSSIRSGPLTVSATIGFASLWLAPRLADFHHLHPGVDVRILATDRDIDFQKESVDIAFGCGDYNQRTGTSASYLFDDEVFPVCSPGYLKTHPQLNNPGALLNHNLLHLDEDVWRALSCETIDWSGWLASQGVDSPLRSHGIWINNYPLLLQTAVNNQGVALGWRHLVDDLLEQGLLVRPFETSLHTQRGYYMVVPTQRSLTREAQIFREWVLQLVE